MQTDILDEYYQIVLNSCVLKVKAEFTNKLEIVYHSKSYKHLSIELSL